MILLILLATAACAFVPTAGIKIQGCAPSQHKLAAVGWTTAFALLDRAAGDLQAHAGASPAYRTWFGAPTHLPRVAAVINATYAAYARGFQTLQCDDGVPRFGDRDCDEGVFTFVFPVDYKQTIKLCAPYFEMPAVEMGGAILHELTHFSVNGGTEDIHYGRDACKRLARADPAQAAENADNYRFYAEGV